MAGGHGFSSRDHRVHRGGGDDGTRRRSRSDDERERQGQRSDDRRPPLASSPSALDFFSLSFNAALALSAPGLLPPDPRAPVLDNVTACRRLLPAGAEGAFPDAEERLFSGGAEKRKPPRRALTTAAAAASRPHQKRVPALDAIAEASTGGSSDQGGPLALLKRAYDSKSQVMVVTRHARGVRGAAVGTLAGFDVFMNLILKDVVEEYRVRVPVTRERPPKRGGGDGGATADERDGEGEEAEKAPRRRLRHGYRLESRTRSLRLVFLRGDSVVLVSSIGSSGS
jgi:small nuclear ribonucleoprotein (snRNP)-like protein